MDADLFSWYWDMPIVTRLYFTGKHAGQRVPHPYIFRCLDFIARPHACSAPGSFLVTSLCALDVISAYQLYFNYRQIARGEVRKEQCYIAFARARSRAQP